jgi:DNA polymerase IV
MATRHPEPILHVDMDAFFASVEQRDQPSLAGRPVAVGGASDRGVVAAASYEARRFGVRSAQPMALARRLCPDLVVVRPRVTAYRRESERVMAILRDVTPVVEPLSLDEAFLDVAGAVTLFGSPPDIGAQIRARIRDEVGLGCSVGVAPTRSVAKLLSTLAKPDGLLHWRADEVAARLRPLPVDAMWGVGPVAGARLEAAGVRTVGDVLDVDVVRLERAVGPGAATRLRALAQGIDPRPVEPAAVRRSVSAETTFPTDLAEPDAVARHLRRLAATVARRLRASRIAARTVTVKLRDADYATRTRSATGPPTDVTAELFDRAWALVEASGQLGRPLRLVGVAAGGLEPATARQLSLDAPGDELRRSRLDQVADEAARRFGREVLAPAVLVRAREVRP